MKRWIPIPLLCLAASAFGQTLSDKPVMLEGASAADRQVRGTADATSESEAINARTVQAGTYAFAAATGANDWAVTLDPAPATVSAGMRLMVQVASDNSGPVTITVNGSGPHAVVKNASVPLEANDVAAGETVSLVFDGTAFQLTSARRIQRRPCPSGFIAVNEQYCIEQSKRDSLSFYDAGVLCGNLDGRLCSWGEWYAACTQATTLGLNGMVGDWEWANNAAAADLNARVVGQSTCTHAGATNVLSNVRNFRCCYKR